MKFSYELDREYKGLVRTDHEPQTPSRAAVEEFLLALKDVSGERLHPAVLYGSIARGEGAVPDTDVDRPVVLEGPVSPVDEIWRCSEATAAISLTHDLVLSPLIVIE